MEIRIRTRSGSISRDLEEYAEKKVTKLDKLSPRIERIIVNLEENASKKKDKSHKVEVLLYCTGAPTLRSEEERDSFYVAIDAALEKLKGQLKKVKTRKLDKGRETAKAVRVAATNGHALDSEPAAKTAREPQALLHETYSARPIAISDVVTELEGDRRFTVFVNEQGHVNALYRRDDGGFTLITPDA